MTLYTRPFANIVGKGENAGNKHLITNYESEGVKRNRLTLSQTLNFRRFQTERVCRRQF